MLYTRAEAETIAVYLYDGGWRHGDRNDLMLDYGLEREPAEQICALLKEFEDAGGYPGSELLWGEEITK